MDSEVWKNLPEDHLILILNAVDDYRYLEYLSLVSRQFLSITNYARRSLTITNEVVPFLPNLLSRFPNIDEINIPNPYFHGDLDGLLRQLSASNILLRSISLPKYNSFPVEGLRHLGSRMGSSLRVLNCSRMHDLKDDDLVTIANTFPFLEELDISCLISPYMEDRMSDAGILHMSLTLKKLRKINISGNWNLTDESIISISSNCLLLEELRIRGCNFSMNEIGIALRDCHHLNSISVMVNPLSRDAEFLKSDEYWFSESLAYATNLRELDVRFPYGSSSSTVDEFLSDLAEANLPLEKLTISGPYATYKAISNLLHKYCSLVYLNVQWSDILTDENVAEMSKFLKHIRYINLGYCRKLTSAAFFKIIRSCPFLSDIRMDGTNVGGIEGFETTYFAINHRVKKLVLSDSKTEMCDEFLKKLAFTCPNLENLSLSGCHGIRVEGLNVVLRNCHKIKKLKINRCYSISEFNYINIALPNLEHLHAKGLLLDDKSLEIIGERCTGLLCLNLALCPNVSRNGVTEVVKKCQNLRRINLMCCNGIDSNTPFPSVSSRSSLRKFSTE